MAGCKRNGAKSIAKASAPRYRSIPDNTGTRLYSWATRERHETATRLLLDVCNITVLEDEFPSWCSLPVATHTGHSAAVVFHLLDRGLNDTFSSQAQCLLLDAIEQGHAVVVEKLLQAGANPDEDALLKAIELGHETIVDKLLQAGADANKGNPLMKAVEGGQEAIVDRLLLAGAVVNWCLWEAVKLGCDAIEMGNEGIVNALLRAGSRPRKDSWWRALQGKKQSIIDMLLKAGSNPNDHNPWPHAVSNRNQDFIDRLLEAGADVNKFATLETAVRDGWWAIIDKLLSAGATPKANDSLRWATRKGNEEVVDKLLHAGADVNGKDVLLTAVEHGYEAICHRLLLAGANPTQPVLLKAVELGHHAIVDKLVLAGVDVNTGDFCLSPLVLAVSRKDEAMVLKLLNAGACFGHNTISNDPIKFADIFAQWDLSFLDRVLQKFAEVKSE